MTTASHDTTARVSVGIPTRNRGPGIVATLQSLSHLDHDSFEVIVVDQSTDARTREAYRDTVGDDRRFSYVQSSKVGRSAACNVALRYAQGELVAFTDDDCVVPADWLVGLERVLYHQPKVSAAFGGVVAASHDHDLYFTPAFMPPRMRLHRSPWLVYRVVGASGGNQMFRTEALREIGGFDEVLGVGAPLRGGEDFDVIYRMLRSGRGVVELPQPAVVHHELKKIETEGRSLLESYWAAEGATYMKHLRLWDIAILPSVIIWFAFRLGWRDLLRLRKPRNLFICAAFVHGAQASLAYPIDRSSRTFQALRKRQSVLQLIPRLWASISNRRG